MSVEQVISILQLTGYLLIIPTCLFLVAGIVFSVRWKRGTWVPREPKEKKIVATQSTSDQKDPHGTSKAQPSRNDAQVKNRKQKSARNTSEDPIHVPSVVTKLPEGAEQLFESLWGRFPDISAEWNILFRKEE